MVGLRLGNVYTEIIAQLSAAGFISLAFGSGIIYQKVRSIKEDLDKFKEVQGHECEQKHSEDKTILQAITKLSTQVETLIRNSETRSGIKRSFAETNCLESD